MRSIASSLGFITVGWSVDSGSWDPGATGESIYSSLANGAFDCTVIELDLDADPSLDGTAVALPWITEDLSAQGYSSVTVPQIANRC